MQTKLKWYHWVASFIIAVICLLIIVGYGLSALATITERRGLNGDMYLYYNLTILQYSIYTGLVAIAGLYAICCVAFYIAKGDATNLTKHFGVF